MKNFIAILRRYSVAMVMNFVELKRYLIIGVVSYAIAVPAAYYAVSRWLESFVEQTGISVRIFILTFVVIMTLTITVAGFQYWSSANADPAEALRKE